MHKHVALEFVAAVEGSITALTGVWFVITVDDHVDLEVVLCLEAFVAQFTLVFT